MNLQIQQMSQTIRIIVLTTFLYGAALGAVNETSAGICNDKYNDINCCPNYHEVDNICVACPTGRWGDNCSLICPINYYGIFCRETCDCHPEEKCDFKLGCMHDPVDSSFPLSTYHTVVVLAALLIIVSYVICLTVCFIKRSKSRSHNVYLHPLHSLGKETNGISETILDNYTTLNKDAFTL